MIRAISGGTSAVGILVGFIGASAGIGDDVLDDAVARREAFIADLVTLFGPDAARATDYLERSWVAEPWIAGVAGIRAPGVMTTCTDAGVVPVGRIHWAGSESSVEFESYMEGAVRAAERAVAAIVGPSDALRNDLP